MALIQCSECHKEISDQAPTCPHCGVPRASKQRSVGAAVGRVFIAFVIAALAIAAGVYVMYRLVISEGDVTRVVPRPVFKLVEVEGTDACSKLLDFCMRVECTVANEGDAHGDVIVTALVDRDNAEALSKSKTVTVPMGSRETVSFDFPEAQLVTTGENVRCQLQGT